MLLDHNDVDKQITLIKAISWSELKARVIEQCVNQAEQVNRIIPTQAFVSNTWWLSN